MLSVLAHAGDPLPDALATVQREIRAFARRKFPRLDPDDVAQATLCNLVRCKPNPDNPVAYVRKVAGNAAIDLARKQPSTVELDEAWMGTGAEDDRLAALLDSDATHAVVTAALEIHVKAGHDRLVRTVTVWLDLAEELGRAPSSREVEPLAGCSHTVVAQGLQRFRATLESLLREAS